MMVSLIILVTSLVLILAFNVFLFVSQRKKPLFYSFFCLGILLYLSHTFFSYYLLNLYNVSSISVLSQLNEFLQGNISIVFSWLSLLLSLLIFSKYNKAFKRSDRLYPTAIAGGYILVYSFQAIRSIFQYASYALQFVVNQTTVTSIQDTSVIEFFTYLQQANPLELSAQLISFVINVLFIFALLEIIRRGNENRQKTNLLEVLLFTGAYYGGMILLSVMMNDSVVIEIYSKLMFTITMTGFVVNQSLRRTRNIV